MHLRVGASQDPNELNVVAPAVSALLILQSVSRVSIRGLRFAASGNGGATTNHHLFKEVAAIQVLSGSGVSLEGCEVSQSDANGLFISGGTDIALRSLYIHTVVGGGVHAAGVNGLLLEDSVLRGSALSINRGVNVTVARCEVSHTDNSAIEIFGVPTAMPISDCGATAPTYTVRDSHVHTVGLGRVSDFGGTLQTATSMKLLMPSEPDSNCGVGAGWCFLSGIYLAPADLQCFANNRTCAMPSLITNNIIHDVRGLEYGANALYLDAAASNVTVSSNLCYDVGGPAIYAHCGNDVVISGNVFVSANLQDDRAPYQGCDESGVGQYLLRTTFVQFANLKMHEATP